MPDKQPMSLTRRTVIYVIGICLSLLALEIWHEFDTYSEEIEQAETETANLAGSLIQHAEDTFNIADGTLAIVVQQLGDEGITASALRHSQAIMDASLENARHFRGFFLYGPDGKFLTGSHHSGKPVPDVSARPYFTMHRDDPNLGAVIGHPFRGQATGDWLIPLSRRITGPDGSFLGIVLAAIDATYFASFYQRFDVGRRGSISLLLTDGTLLSRSPFNPDDVGMDLSSAALFTDAMPMQGAYHLVSSIDDTARIAGFARSPEFPLVTVAGVARDDALASWWRDAAIRLCVMIAFVMAVALLGLRLADQLRRRHKAEAQLSARETEFRLITESSSDLISHIDNDGRRVYVSPAAPRVLGFQPEELLGRSVFEIAHPDDVESLKAAADRMRRGEAGGETLAYRALHKDGHEIWLETALTVVPGKDGAPPGVISVTRDISERKALELQLIAMARVDGLTGLANRRAFDAALDVEWRRAQREGAPLSVLLIDVDRFKNFNDHYGHLGGDECLIKIAAAVEGGIKRPGDVAARYGGEELVVLLPQTDTRGAMVMANKLCALVEGLGLAHEHNPPWKVATISIGAASVVPNETFPDRTPQWLLGRADAALYAAKAAGRNRAMSAPEPPGRKLSLVRS